MTAWLNAVHDVFLTAVPFTLVAVALACLIPELELKQADTGGQPVAPPG